MKDVDVKLLRNSPRPARVWIRGDAFIKDAGTGQGQRAINDVGMPRDPTDISHAPVDIFRMNILVVLGCSRDIGQVAAGAMLATLGFAGSPARVQQVEGGCAIQR